MSTAKTVYCAECGSEVIYGYIVIRKGYYSESTGKPMEERVYGNICTQIHGRYRYDGLDAHYGFAMVSGRWSETEIEEPVRSE